MAEQNQGFLDITASDIIGGLLERERIDSAHKIKALEVQYNTQQRALHEPVIDSMQDAVNTGYAAPANTVPGYFQRVPKPLLYGGLGLLATGVLLKVTK